MKKLTLVLFSIGLIFLSGCASTVNTERLKQVESVAVVGFSVFKMAPVDIIPGYEDSKEFKENLASDFYSALTVTLARELNKRFLSQQKISSNTYYQELVQKYASVKKVILSTGKSYRPADFLSGQAIKELGATEKTELMKSLGVDSIIGLEALLYKGSQAKTTFESISVNEIKYRVTLSQFEQYDHDSQNPIASLNNLVGETSEESSLAFSVADGFVEIVSPERKNLIGAVQVVAMKTAEKLRGE